MIKHAIIIKFDIKGFAEQSKPATPAELAQYLRNFYERVSAECAKRQWRLVKTIGDCVLVVAEHNHSVPEITTAHEIIDSEFGINTSYRECEFEETQISLDGYSCLDMVGNDINNLFLEDKQTVTL